MNQEKNKTLKTSLPVRTDIRVGPKVPPREYDKLPTIRSIKDAAEQRGKPINPFI